MTGRGRQKYIGSLAHYRTGYDNYISQLVFYFLTTRLDFLEYIIYIYAGCFPLLLLYRMFGIDKVKVGRKFYLPNINRITIEDMLIRQ